MVMYAMEMRFLGHTHAMGFYGFAIFSRTRPSTIITKKEGLGTRLHWSGYESSLDATLIKYLRYNKYNTTSKKALKMTINCINTSYISIYPSFWLKPLMNCIAQGCSQDFRKGVAHALVCRKVFSWPCPLFPNHILNHGH